MMDNQRRRLLKSTIHLIRLWGIRDWCCGKTKSRICSAKDILTTSKESELVTYLSEMCDRSYGLSSRHWRWKYTRSLTSDGHPSEMEFLELGGCASSNGDTQNSLLDPLRDWRVLGQGHYVLKMFPHCMTMWKTFLPCTIIHPSASGIEMNLSLRLVTCKLNILLCNKCNGFIHV
jgi:hypothetical protein